MRFHAYYLFFLGSLLCCFAISLEANAKPTQKTRARKLASQTSESAKRIILEAESKREFKTKGFASLAKHPEQSVARAAIIAMGRIGSEEAIEVLLDRLRSGSNEIRRIAAFSLGLLGTAEAGKAIQQNLEMHTDSKVIAALLIAFARTNPSQAVPRATKTLSQEADANLVAASAEALAIAWSSDSKEWPVPTGVLKRLVELSSRKEAVALPSCFALSRFKGKWDELPPPMFSGALPKIVSPLAKSYCLRALSKQKSPAVESILAAELTTTKAPTAILIEALKGLGNQDYSPVVSAAITQVLEDPLSARFSAAVIATALDTVSTFNLAAHAQSPKIEQVYLKSKSSWVRAAALKAWAKVNPSAAKPKLLEIWGDPKNNIWIQGAAGFGLASLGEDTVLDHLASTLETVNSWVVIETLDGLIQLNDEKMTTELKMVLRRLVEKGDLGVVCQTAALVEKHKHRELIEPLSTVYRFFQEADLVEARVSILNAIKAVGDTSSMEVVQLGLSDNQKTVVIAAIGAYETLSGKKWTKPIPLNSIYAASIPSQAELAQATKSRIVFKTSKGDIVVKMSAAAPVTAATIVKLAKQGFYRNKVFHRVVPNFVAQGGDPRGDGFGGPGFLIRDEVSDSSHQTGTIGIATAGKDTGGSQFFFNLNANYHLDGRYTLFGTIVKGLSVAERIEVGDVIDSTFIQ